MPQYDNIETRDWLSGFILSIGLIPRKEDLVYFIEKSSVPFVHYSIAVDYVFHKSISHRFYGKKILFSKGQRIKLFRSCRHTPKTIESFCKMHRIHILSAQIARNGQEAAFLVTKKARSG